MYQKYFGFKERPFQLVPNPAYLFLSRSHEEAMAHLTYAVSEGDGFIAIIGEVGTGKTTLCRAFIESLDDRREVAYIFNPKLSPVELLEAVCDEFDIRVPRSGATKDLIDTLNRFLLEKKAEGKQVMLIIDEAQNLSREVLEQLRLLSNLETNTEKLLQIVLAGQPELDELLESYELRQLSQRITLSCHLAPLTFQETGQYIQHRIRIAARNQGVEFTRQALRKIHAYSRGVPRLIHIVCDRALLIAYVVSREKITGPIVDSAIRELGSRKNIGRLRAAEKRKTALLAVLLGLLMVTLFIMTPMKSDVATKTDSVKTFKIPIATQEESPATSAALPAETPAPSEAVDDTAPEGTPEPAETTTPTPMPTTDPARSDPARSDPARPDPARSDPARTDPEQADPNQTDRVPSNTNPAVPAQAFTDQTATDPAAPAQASALATSHLAKILVSINTIESQRTALSNALTLWGTSLPILEYSDKRLIDPETYFNLTARKNGYLIHRTECSLSEISKLNLPAIFEFNLGNLLRPHFLTLSRINERTLTFLADTAGEKLELSYDDIDGLWTGFVYIPWINFYQYEGVTPISGEEQGIRMLKHILEEIGYGSLPRDPVYDTETKSAVREVQSKYGIPVDGFVGPLTKMALYSELPGLEIPHIRENDGSPQSTEEADEPKVID